MHDDAMTMRVVIGRVVPFWVERAWPHLDTASEQYLPID